MGNTEAAPSRLSTPVVNTEPAASLQPVAAAVNDDAQANFRKLLQDQETKGWSRFDDLLFKLSAGGIGASLICSGSCRTPSSLSDAGWYSGLGVCGA